MEQHGVEAYIDDLSKAYREVVQDICKCGWQDACIILHSENKVLKKTLTQHSVDRWIKQVTKEFKSDIRSSIEKAIKEEFVNFESE